MTVATTERRMMNLEKDRSPIREEVLNAMRFAIKAATFTMNYLSVDGKPETNLSP